ncbi:MAG: hypothetical protein ACK5U7_15150 [Bacteroidota bacterium]
MPDNPEALAALIEEHVQQQLTAFSYRRLIWNLVYHYLNGCRRFDVFDPKSNTIRPYELDEQGRLELQGPEVVRKIDQVTGLLASLDFRPRVGRTGSSLRSMRERAGAQVIVDNIINDNTIRPFKVMAAHVLASLGCVGIQGHVKDLPVVGLTGHLEVIHPRELLPFPAATTDYTKQQSFIRIQAFPLKMLEEKLDRKLTEKELQGCKKYRRRIGDTLAPDHHEANSYPHSPSRSSGSTLSGGSGKARDEMFEDVILTRQLWNIGHGGLVHDFVVSSGRSILLHQKAEGVPLYPSIGIARFIENGSFYGIGAFDIVFHYARSLEKMVKLMLQNISDMDSFGCVVLPQTMDANATLKQVGPGLKALFHSPDPSLYESNFRPFPITPFNTGDAAGRGAAFIQGLMQTVDPYPDLAREKGRVESAAGLRMLDDKLKSGTVTGTTNLTAACAVVYRSMLIDAASMLLTSPRPIPVSRLTLDLAGVSIDTDTMQVQFNDNPLPNVNLLTVDLTEGSPQNPLVAKMEAVELLKLGVNTPESFKRYCIKQGIDLAADIDGEKAAQETAVIRILTIFNDGKSPGEVVLTQYNTRPDVELALLSDFLPSPVVQFASPDVQNALGDYRDALIQFSGRTLPEAVPSPVDMATLNQGPMNPLQSAGGAVGAPPMQM